MAKKIKPADCPHCHGVTPPWNRIENLMKAGWKFRIISEGQVPQHRYRVIAGSEFVSDWAPTLEKAMISLLDRMEAKFDA